MGQPFSRLMMRAMPFRRLISPSSISPTATHGEPCGFKAAKTNLPTLLAGGGLKHGQHLAFDTQRNYPLPNLFVSMLQRLGIETDKFASSTGTMRGLEMV